VAGAATTKTRGVTALPAELSHVLDTDFVCDNADFDAYGERVDP
jgi:hypothetical protein